MLLFQFLFRLSGHPIIEGLYLVPLLARVCHNATYTTITIKVTWPLLVYLPCLVFSSLVLPVVSLFWLQPHFSLKQEPEEMGLKSRHIQHLTIRHAKADGK